MNADAMEGNDMIETHSPRVACDGGGGPLGHPRVYISLRETGEGVCSYCGRHYIYKPCAGEGGGH